MHYDTIIFDLDGTLLYSIEDLCNSTNYALKRFHFPERSIEEITAFVGNGVHRLIERAVPMGTSKDVIQATFECFHKHYKEHMLDHTRPYDDILLLLRELKSRNIKTAIASNKYDVAVKQLSDSFFGSLIDVALGESPETSKKPAPDLVYKALTLLNSTNSRCLYVGDSDVDMSTAINAHVTSVGVTWGYRSKECLIASKATHIISNPLELLNLL